jgi:hypothetical protein
MQRYGANFLLKTIKVSKPLNTIPPRVVIYVKDVMNITGRSNRTARALLSRIRKHFKKDRNAFISIDEFCSFTGLKQELVSKFL